jgi:hypothetical protein
VTSAQIREQRRCGDCLFSLSNQANPIEFKLSLDGDVFVLEVAVNFARTSLNFSSSAQPFANPLP